MFQWGLWIFEKTMKPPSMYWGITIFTHFLVRVCQKVQFFKVSKIWQKLLWKSLTLFFVCKAPIFAKNLKGMHIYGKLRYIRFTCKQDLGPKTPGKNTVSSWSLSKYCFSNMPSYHYEFALRNLTMYWPKVWTHEKIFFKRALEVGKKIEKFKISSHNSEIRPQIIKLSSIKVA